MCHSINQRDLTYYGIYQWLSCCHDIPCITLRNSKASYKNTNIIIKMAYQVLMPKEDDGMKQQIMIKTTFAKKTETPIFAV